MKSSRATVEKVGQLAKAFEAVIDLAEDHADLEALERAMTTTQRNLASAKEELEGINVRLQAVKDAEEKRKQDDTAALKKRDDILAEARGQADDIRKKAKDDADDIIEAAYNQANTAAATHDRRLNEIKQDIKEAEGELSQINTNIGTARNTHNQLQDNITEAKNYLSKLANPK